MQTDPVAHDSHALRQTLGGAQILENWKGRDQFVILNTQFDSTHHFLATWRAWRNDEQRPKQLHYIAIVDFPFVLPQLCPPEIDFPDMQSGMHELTERWPKAVAGFHRILLSDKDFVLTLIFGDLDKSLRQIVAQVDAFYLNNLRIRPASKTNSVDTLISIGRLAAPLAVLALSGHEGTNDETLAGSGFTSVESAPEGTLARFAPRWPVRQARFVECVERHAIVIGAGLAGASACQRLADRDWKITLIEQHANSAGEASGNPAGIFMPWLTQDDSPGARLSAEAYLFAMRLWQKIGGIGIAFSGEACGALQFARDASRANAGRKIAASGRYPPEFVQWLDDDACQAVMGSGGKFANAESRSGTYRHGALLFPQGGWAQPGELCETMLQACGDRLHRIFSCRVDRLQRVSGHWQVLDEGGKLLAQAPHLILANGVGARDLPQTLGLPLDAVRGQVTLLPDSALPRFPMVVCGDGYLTPSFAGHCCIGASYDDDDDPALRQASQQENLARLDHIFPGAAAKLVDYPLSGRVGFRCVSADRLPLVGAIPDPAAMASFRGERLRDVPRLPGLFGLFGYASRGLVWSAIAAELLAAQICGEPLPLERELAATLDPARFYLPGKRRDTKAD